MFRYIAFCWNDKNEEESRVALRLTTHLDSNASGWNIALRGPCVRVYAKDEHLGASGVVHLQNGHGLVLGTLFGPMSADAGQETKRALTIDQDESARIATSAGRRLIETYWGRYVAVIQNQSTGHLWIIRDPTGALPCLCLKIDGVQIFAADIEDCCDLTTSNFSINWPYVRARVLVRSLQVTATGLDGVSQLLPGRCLELRGGVSTEISYWEPHQIAKSSIVESEGEAILRLRNVVTNAVHAWAHCYKTILLKLSGGIDSAIILGCLSTATTRPEVICVNDYSQGSDTDERRYARLAAKRADCALIERERDPSAPLERVFAFRRSYAPIQSHVWIQTQPTNEELVSRYAATALFTGNGGDHLFLAGHSHWPLADHLHCHGPSPRAIRIARESSYLEPPARCQSMWSLLRNGVRVGLLSGKNREPFTALASSSDWTMVNAGVVEAFRREYRSWLPPWFQGDTDLPPGKIIQAYRLSFPNTFYPLSVYQSDSFEPVHPLLSQPVLELCLRTRTYALTSGDMDRMAVRRAFEHVLPVEIATRRTKGGVNDHAVDVLLRNVRFIREFLLDGELVRHGVLNKSVLENILGGKDEGLSVGSAPIINLLQVEAWLQAWLAPTRTQAVDPPFMEANASTATAACR